MSQIILLPLSKTVKAETQDTVWSWSATKPVVFSSTKISGPISWCSGFLQTEEIGRESGSKNVCITLNGNVKFGTYFTGSTFLSVVGFPYDNKMYRVNGVCGQYDSCLYLPGSDTLVTKQYLINGMVRSLVLYKNFTHRLTPHIYGLIPTYQYDFDRSNPDYIFRNADGYAWPIGGISVSENGKWLAIEFRQRGIGLFNTETFEMKRISTMAFSYGTGYDPSSELAVSNDGRHVAVMGFNASLTVFDVDSNCGDEATDSKMISVTHVTHICKISPIDVDDFIYRFFYGTHPRFNDDGGELNFYTMSYVGESRQVSLRATGYNPHKLDYLALGDSFTSGEGETNDKYYLNGTNDKYEKCHVSYRSYPFLISDFMKIDTLNMASVACSGAETTDVVGTNSDYWGQGDRLKDKTNPDKTEKTEAQSYALYAFLPGRIHQESFVKEYSPKIITIGVGGNDAGLMDKLNDCAGKGTCSWASNAKSKEQTADEIKRLFGNLVKTYQELNIASPNSKIYAIGYPKIIDQSGKCDLLTGYLFDDAEKQFMNESIIYLDQVIESAAKAAGIKYIDIQDSYGNHVLCGSESPSAMNGVRTGDDNQYNWFLNIGNESFHPNSLGHAYDASAIEESVSNLIDYDYCDNGAIICPDSTVIAPEPSTYWLPDIHHNYPAQQIANYVSDRDGATDNQQKQIVLDSNSLAPDSSVDIEMTSSPISLGHFTASSDGSLNVNIDLPADLEEGYHTVHLYGTSYSGESIELYQVIEYRKPVAPTEGPKVEGNTNVAQNILESASVNTQKVDKEDGTVTVTDNNGVSTDRLTGDNDVTAPLSGPAVKGASIVAGKTSALAKINTNNFNSTTTIIIGLFTVSLVVAGVLITRLIRKTN
jgi:lysophospholipase L1-like esterase